MLESDLEPGDLEPGPRASRHSSLTLEAGPRHARVSSRPSRLAPRAAFEPASPEGKTSTPGLPWFIRIARAELEPGPGAGPGAGPEALESPGIHSWNAWFGRGRRPPGRAPRGRHLGSPARRCVELVTVADDAQRARARRRVTDSGSSVCPAAGALGDHDSSFTPSGAEPPSPPYPSASRWTDQ